MFAFGSIVLARFPFTDLSGEKRRPVLVVSGDNDRRVDLVVCFITLSRGRDLTRRRYLLIRGQVSSFSRSFASTSSPPSLAA